MPHPNKRVTKPSSPDSKQKLEAITESLLLECSEVIREIDIKTLRMALAILNKLETLTDETERQIILHRYKPLLDLAEKKEGRLAAALGIGASPAPGFLLQQYFADGSKQIIHPDVAKAIGIAARPVALIEPQEDLSDG